MNGEWQVDGLASKGHQQEPRDWRRSRSCAAASCVEVTRDGDHVLMRSSDRPLASPQWFTRSEFQAFLQGAKDGDFDDLL
ncbi:MAG TPA: DUF397 domain-containing protein [Kineosporiaceae bacterium]|nr:DUF397 domain-containing protein [Kineosporiaceae bacterium]